MAKIIEFYQAKQALELNAVKREILREVEQKTGGEPARSLKKAVVISALPGEALPPKYPDFRPLLQRGGLILLSWAKWNNHPRYGLCYRVNWMKSSGKTRRYASGFVYDLCTEKEIRGLMPSQNGDLYWKDGISGTRVWYQAEDIGDIIFRAAPELNFAIRSLYIQKLKEAGIAVDFDYEFSLGKAREVEFKKEAAKIEALNVSKTVSPHLCVWGAAKQ